MRARFTQYAVPGWGVGELWTDDRSVLAHEFRFDAATGPPTVSVSARPSNTRAEPPVGAQSPPTGTLRGASAQVGNGFMPDLQQDDLSVDGRPSAGGQARASDPAQLVRRFEAFFAGEDVELRDVPIELGWATPFQRAVATALRRVPRGEIVSYGELAALAGYAGAARAVGTFCAHNRFMFLVPCHRVVGAAGIGGYGSAGTETKRRLLALEGVAV